MKPTVALLLALALPSFALACACSLPAAESAASNDAPATSGTVAPALGHPLRGVILKLVPEKQALLVQHEEIPDVMRAMTMLLKVDAATFATAKENQAITATLLRLDDGWWLRDVSPAK